MLGAGPLPLPATQHQYPMGGRESIARQSLASAAPQPPWMEGFGGLSDLGDEHRLVLDAIENEFERLSPEDIP